MSELVDYGLRIERGEIKDPGFHLTLYTAPPEADPWKYATWKLANPALGDFRSLEDVKRLALQAQRMPASGLSFRRFILNQRVDTTAQFLNMATWKANGENRVTPGAGRAAVLCRPRPRCDEGHDRSRVGLSRRRRQL